MAKSRRVPDDDDDAPPRRSRATIEDDEGDDLPQKPRKKRKSAAGPVRLILKICLGVALSIGLIVLLYWIYSPVGADPDLFCYFPKETVRITGYDVGEVTKNHKLAEVHGSIMSNYNRFSSARFSATGLKDTDVDKYLYGVAAGAEDEKDLVPQERRGSITVIRFKQAPDQNKFLASFSGAYKAEPRQTKDGKTYQHLFRLYPVPPDQRLEREDDISFFWPNDRTLVYTSTWRECEECMTRVPGRVVVDGNMRELANKVDGHYFQASTGPAAPGFSGAANTMAFGLGIVDEEIRDQSKYGGVIGSASWFADNGNEFLYASASLYSDRATARKVRNTLAVSYGKAQADVWQSEAGRASGLEDPFNAKPKDQPGGAGGFAGSTSSEQTKDIIAALNEYVRSARVYSRDRLVVVEGTIPHGTPEQGIFEKFWKAIGSRVATVPGIGPEGMPGGFGPPGGMPGRFGPPGGMPGGFVPPGRGP